MTPAQAIDRANKAKALLDNPMFEEAFALVRAALHDSIEKCPQADVQSAEHFRKCLKLLRDVKANVIVAIEDGKVEAFNIEQEKIAKKNPFRNYFR
jgi:hypothetical protein